MILPDGVPQNSACVLIAMREFFNDPSWVDDDLVNELQHKNTPDQVQARNGSYTGYTSSKMPELCARAGMFSPGWAIPVRFMNQGFDANDDMIHILVNHQLHYAVPRMNPCVVSYWTNKEQTKGHTMCCPLHVAFCFIACHPHGWSHIGVDSTGMQFLGIKI